MKAQLAGILFKAYLKGATVPTLVATDLVLAGGLDVNLSEVESKERDNNTGFFGNQGSIAVSSGCTANFDVELGGSGTAGTAPAWAKLLQPCGMSVVSAGSSVTITPTSNQAHYGAMWYVNDGLVQKMHSCAGGFEIALDNNSVPMIKFDFKAVVGSRAAAGAISGTTSAYKIPQAVSESASTVKIGGAVVACSKFSFKAGVESDYYRTTESEEVIIGGRKSTISLTIRGTNAVLIAHISNAESSEYTTIENVHGTTTGGIFNFNAANCQYKSSKLSFDGDIGVIEMEFDVVPLTDSSDFSLVIT